MQPFEWTAEHAVYLPNLDAEHESLFHLVDDLQAAVLAEPTDPTRIVEASREMIAAARKHFSSEERKMRVARYPSYAWHKQQHNAVRKRMNLYGPLIENADVQAAIALLEFFTGWLKDHTALTDRMMSAYLRNHQRQALGAAQG